MDKLCGDFQKSLHEELKQILDEKNRIIMVQEKDIGYLKRKITELKNEINCFQDEKK